eukprot:TRINITY_DN10549_c2_g1_i1.p1 TRINITY_DN10549_c2_g1~~TRINITY_DN10549_c2_g1_i1.p1  ORF type:complete len:595 (+),score=134.34 TRINITY_DN10549_c2_g1_i1:73-1857(+)
MCSFILANFIIRNLAFVNFFLRPRGPDLTTHVHVGGFDFVHNLLHMTGERRAQPFLGENVAALFNGEIYNWRELLAQRGWQGVSDGDVILPLYRELGDRFPSVLDGEFAIAVLDFARGELLLSTDVFGTKPLWYAVDRTATPARLAVASYRSALLRMEFSADCIKMVDPNTVLRLSLAAGRILGRRAIFEFDLRQFKTSTDDFVEAFRAAVAKRTTGLHPAFVGLSSGYDSGALHLALHVQGKKHYAFAVFGEEDQDILARRIELAAATTETNLVIFSSDDFDIERRWLSEKLEHFDYLASNETGQRSVLDDQASVGLSYVMRLSRDRGALAYLSGSGADEVLSDYGFQGERFCPQSTFGGLFPAALSEIFPWAEFFLSTQRDYLMKEELVAGAHGMEGRYPFLDARVVQEYLWLSSDLKNAEYKAPVYDLFTRHGYAFERGKKRGFAAAANHFANHLDGVRPADAPGEASSDAGKRDNAGGSDGRPTVVLRYNRHPEPRCGAPPASPGVAARCSVTPAADAFGDAASCQASCAEGYAAVQDSLRCSLHGRWVGELVCLDERLQPSADVLEEMHAHAPALWGNGAPEAPRVADA